MDDLAKPIFAWRMANGFLEGNYQGKPPGPMASAEHIRLHKSATTRKLRAELRIKDIITAAVMEETHGTPPE
jgi:hypothetical protein